MKRKIPTITAIILIILIVSLSACSNEAEDPQKITTTNEMQNALNEIGEIAESNANVEVEKYITPAESAFTYEECEGGVAITGYSGDDKAITVPESIGGKSVVAISEKAFSNSLITGIILPDSIIRINPSAFYYCTTVVEVELGAGVKEIGEKAFEGCIALSELKLNDGLEVIGELAFGYCTMLKNVDLPKSLIKLGRGAFCLSGIEAICIPGSVEIIEEQAFSTCMKLSSVTIENGVKTIETKAFEACTNLAKVYLPNSVESFGNRVFNQCGNVTIFASAGSTAEEYAKESDICFAAE